MARYFFISAPLPSPAALSHSPLLTLPWPTSDCPTTVALVVGVLCSCLPPSVTGHLHQPCGVKCHSRANGQGQVHGRATCVASYTRLDVQKGLELNLMLSWCCVKAFIISPLSWCFCKWSLMGQWSVCQRKGDTLRMGVGHHPRYSVSIGSAPGAQNAGGATVRDVQSVRQMQGVQDSGVTSTTKTGDTDVSKRRRFPLDPEQKEDCCSTNTNSQQTLCTSWDVRKCCVCTRVCCGGRDDDMKAKANPVPSSAH